MKASLCLLVLAACAAAGAHPAPVQDVSVVKPGEVKWVDAKGHPKGVQTCLIHGDPSKEAFVVMLKVPAGTVYPPHFHSADEVVTVVSGSFMIGSGEKVDEARASTVEAGGYFSFKAKTPHWAKAVKDTVAVRYGNGKADITYCHPADDPSKK